MQKLHHKNHPIWGAIREKRLIFVLNIFEFSDKL